METLEPWWIVGFTDGEGWFSTRIHINVKRKRWGAQVQPVFGIGQQNREILERIKACFGFGRIFKFRESWVFRCVKIKDIPKIRDFFLIYPLQTPKKQKIFELWSEIVSIVEQRCHLTKDGLLRCAELRDQMASIQYTKGKLKWSAKDIKKVVDSAGRRGHYNYYTAKELSFLKENYGKMPTTEIAMRLKRSAYSIRWHARQLGVTRHKHTE